MVNQKIPSNALTTLHKMQGRHGLTVKNKSLLYTTILVIYKINVAT